MPGSVGLLRPPYGEHNSTVDSIAASLGYSIMMWNINTQDVYRRNPGQDQEILDTVLSGARPNGIVLMHMHVENTVLALPRMIEGLHTAGYVLSF